MGKAMSRLPAVPPDASMSVRAYSGMNPSGNAHANRNPNITGRAMRPTSGWSSGPMRRPSGKVARAKNARKARRREHARPDAEPVFLQAGGPAAFEWAVGKERDQRGRQRQRRVERLRGTRRGHFGIGAVLGL